MPEAAEGRTRVIETEDEAQEAETQKPKAADAKQMAGRKRVNPFAYVQVCSAAYPHTTGKYREEERQRQRLSSTLKR